jgi:hypothetical protein
LATAVRPRLKEVLSDLGEMTREPKRLALIALGCATTTLGMVLALWASIEAIGGTTSFVVTVVTMVGGTRASAAPIPAASARSRRRLSVVLPPSACPRRSQCRPCCCNGCWTCWLPVFIGWPITRWLTEKGHDLTVRSGMLVTDHPAHEEVPRLDV